MDLYRKRTGKAYLFYDDDVRQRVVTFPVGASGLFTGTCAYDMLKSVVEEGRSRRVARRI